MIEIDRILSTRTSSPTQNASGYGPHVRPASASPHDTRPFTPILHTQRCTPHNSERKLHTVYHLFRRDRQRDSEHSSAARLDAREQRRRRPLVMLTSRRTRATSRPTSLATTSRPRCRAAWAILAAHRRLLDNASTSFERSQPSNPAGGDLRGVSSAIVAVDVEVGVPILGTAATAPPPLLWLLPWLLPTRHPRAQSSARRPYCCGKAARACAKAAIASAAPSMW